MSGATKGRQVRCTPFAEGPVVGRHPRDNRKGTARIFKKSDEFRIAPLEFDGKTIVLTGPSGMGKTSWALAHFKNPLLVSTIEDLKQLKDYHDGVVFDDVNVSHMSVESVIHLLDVKNNRSVRCRYSNARLKKGLNRIFTTNRKLTWPNDHIFPYPESDDHMDAFLARIEIYKVTAPVFAVPETDDTE